MSITLQLFRALRHHTACSDKFNVSLAQHQTGIRRLHSVISATSARRNGISSRSLRLSFNAKAAPEFKTYGRGATSIFIINRNESTTTVISNHANGADQAVVDSKPIVETLSEEMSKLHLTTASPASNTDKVLSSVETSGPQETLSSTISNSPDLIDVSHQALIFEKIPEPPALPVSIEEITGVILGEPSLASLGLGGWSPSGMVQQCLEYFHIGLGMPWWASIILGTVIVRTLLFPLVVKSQRNAARMQNHMPQLQLLQTKMTEARQTGNAIMAAKYGQDMVVFMKEKGISPFKTLLVPLAMAPVFVSCFFGIRKMANLPVESMRDGGLFWFTDLTIADPLFLLPLITSITVFITFEIGADGVKLNASHGVLLKYFMRAIPVIMFPFTMNFPAAILCYWVSTNAISLVQVSLLKIPAVRQKLDIEPLRKITPDMLPVKKKGFKESFKDSWTNMRISKEIEERTKYDEISFKRAGRGPIPKTYKYDPTKVNPLKDAAAAIQAKRK